jgi:argininosuccinate lyase
MSQNKLWGGRFTEKASESLDQFWNSIGFDYRLAPYDVRGSIAHARMLGATGIIPREDSERLIQGLRDVLSDVEAGRIEFRLHDEDVHMNVERILSERIGKEIAGKLHTARSRNDQVALDMHLFVLDQCGRTIDLLRTLQAAFLNRAEVYSSVIIPGYTHLQRAQPVLFAHHLLAYFWMLQRDIDRLQSCRRRADLSPLGAGAIAGTTFPIDRQMVATELGFSGIYPNSMDAVSDRDFVIDMLMANALIAGHLSRFCEEVVIWMSSEFSFIRLSDAFCTGSSMMPQKKNPDLAELVRGKTGRVYGSLMTMLTVLKGVPLTYNKDFQEDKECLFDSVDTVQQSLFHLAGMVAKLTVDGKSVQRATVSGFLNATDVADYMVRKGVPFREAHEAVGGLVGYCLEQDKPLEHLTLEEFRQFGAVFEADIYEHLKLETVVGRRNSAGGTSPAAVKLQFTQARETLAQTEAWLDQNKFRLFEE